MPYKNITSNGFNDTFGRKIVRSSTGILHCVYLSGSKYTGNFQIGYARSSDEGLSWQNEIISGEQIKYKTYGNSSYRVISSASEASIAIDTSNNVYITWTENYKSLYDNESYSFTYLLKQYTIELYEKNNNTSFSSLSAPILLNTKNDIINLFFTSLPTSFWNNLPYIPLTKSSYTDIIFPQELYDKFPSNFWTSFSNLNNFEAQQVFKKTVYSLVYADNTNLDLSGTYNQGTIFGPNTNTYQKTINYSPQIFYRTYTNQWNDIVSITETVSPVVSPSFDTNDRFGGEHSIISIDAEDNFHIIWSYKNRMYYVKKSINDDFVSYGPNFREFARGSPIAFATDSKGFLHILYSQNVKDNNIRYFSNDISLTSDAILESENSTIQLIYANFTDIYHRQYAYLLGKSNALFTGSMAIDSSDYIHISWNIFHSLQDNVGRCFYTKFDKQNISSEELFEFSSSSSICLNDDYIYIISDYYGDISYREYTTSWQNEVKLFDGYSVNGYFKSNSMWSFYPGNSRPSSGFNFIYFDGTNQGSSIYYYYSEDLSFPLTISDIVVPSVSTSGGKRTTQTNTDGSVSTDFYITINITNDDDSTTSSIINDDTTINIDGTVIETLTIDDTNVVLDTTSYIKTIIVSTTNSNGTITSVSKTTILGDSIDGDTGQTTTTIDSQGNVTSTASSFSSSTYKPTPSTLINIDNYMFSVVSDRWSPEAVVSIIEENSDGTYIRTIDPSDYIIVPRKSLVIFKNSMDDNKVYRAHIFNPPFYKPGIKILNREENYVQIYGIAHAYNEVASPTEATINTPLCNLNLNSSGFFRGFDQTFPSNDGEYYVFFEYDMLGDQDQLIVSFDSVEQYNTGCTIGSGTFYLYVLSTVSEIRIQIIPNCSIGDPTPPHWTLTTYCQAVPPTE